MFCKHKWKVISSTKFENELTKFIGSGCRLNGFTASDLTKRGVITVVQCEKCTKVIHEKIIFQ